MWNIYHIPTGWGRRLYIVGKAESCIREVEHTLQSVQGEERNHSGCVTVKTGRKGPMVESAGRAGRDHTHRQHQYLYWHRKEKIKQWAVLVKSSA